MEIEVTQSIESPTELGRLAYRPEEAAQLLGVSRSRVFQLIKSKELASVRYGRTRLIPLQAIDQFLINETSD